MYLALRSGQLWWSENDALAIECGGNVALGFGRALLAMRYGIFVADNKTGAAYGKANRNCGRR